MQEEGEVEDVETLLEEDHKWKVGDQEKKEQHLEIDLYQHLDKDKI